MRFFNSFCRTVIIIFYGYFGGRILIEVIFPIKVERQAVEVVAVQTAWAIEHKAGSVEIKDNLPVKYWYGKASWYGSKFHGRKMANGEPFDMNNPSYAAHRQLPFGSELEVTNLRNGKKIKVIIVDRGPFTRDKHKKFTRDLDVSYAAAVQLEFDKAGLTEIKVEEKTP